MGVAVPESNGVTHITVVNGEDQYSVWPAGIDLPAGWTGTGFRGTEDECLDHVSENWRDITPRSVRRTA